MLLNEPLSDIKKNKLCFFWRTEHELPTWDMKTLHLCHKRNRFPYSGHWKIQISVLSQKVQHCHVFHIQKCLFLKREHQTTFHHKTLSPYFQSRKWPLKSLVWVSRHPVHIYFTTKQSETKQKIWQSDKNMRITQTRKNSK